MNSGKERVFPYIIYSNMQVFGRFALSVARVAFEHNNEKQTVYIVEGFQFTKALYVSLIAILRAVILS